MLHDKGDNGEDLTGGYHDGIRKSFNRNKFWKWSLIIENLKLFFKAGDLVKFNFPMAYAITVTSWGAIDYEDAFVKSGELQNVHKMIKWGTDYFLKVSIVFESFKFEFIK